MVQYLISRTGWDPTQGPQGTVSCSGDNCVISMGATDLTVDSVMLMFSGINSLIQALLLTTIGNQAKIK